MKIPHFLVATLLLSGCASGPRSYDGVLGYRTEPVPEGLQVTYVDEADRSTEKILFYISEVCSEAFAPTAVPLVVKVNSVSEYGRQVGVSVPIPVGVQTIGTYSSGGNSVGGASIQSSITQIDTIYRDLKLKEVVAICSNAGAS